MADFKVDYSQLRRLERSLGKSEKKLNAGRKNLLKKIGSVVLGLARRYCPESPTKAQYASQNKSGKTNRKASSITTGSLRDSITTEVKKDYVSINVPSNSKGGKYAEKIHDEKDKTWWDVGIRTKQKGAKADEKYIYRAAEDGSKEIDALIDQVITEFTKGIGI